jgi:NTE family protein
MYNLGVKPESVTGTSAGALVATLVAAGIDTRKVEDVAKDPALKKFFDATFEGPGVLEGRELYRFLDQKLRDITGIKDRPVTFADLPIPLQLVTTKLADSQAPNDMTRLQDRIFVFSKDTTPNTPVAFAAVASAAIPAGFDPIEMVDVATGRTIRLADGGVVDNLPLGYQKNKNLPELAIQLNEPNINSGDPNDRGTPQPFPPGNLISDNPFGNARIGLDLQAKAATGQRDFFDRINPPANTFVLNVPTWNLQNFEQQNTTLQFEYDDKIDPALDKQTTTIAQNFFKQFLPQFGVAGARGSNLKTPPTTNDFNRTFVANGANWTATHTNGADIVVFQSDTGKKYDIKIGNDRLRDWVADDRSFGDLGFRLRDVVVDFEKFLLFN